MYLQLRNLKRLAFIGLIAFFSIKLHAEALPIKNIVLVHGAFTDGSSWSEVITRLQSLGYHVTAVQNPLTSLRVDVAATRSVLERQQGDVLLVGHSWGGAVITEAGNAANVKGLVYLSALVPDSNESVADALQRLKAPMEGMQADSNGLIWLDDPKIFHDVMANDVSQKKAALLAAAQQPIAARAFAEKVTQAAWRNKPSWYLVTENDHALRPAVQSRFASAIGANTTRLNASHMSMISHPEKVAEWIDKAARGMTPSGQQR